MFKSLAPPTPGDSHNTNPLALNRHSSVVPQAPLKTVMSLIKSVILRFSPDLLNQKGIPLFLIHALVVFEAHILKLPLSSHRESSTLWKLAFTVLCTYKHRDRIARLHGAQATRFWTAAIAFAKGCVPFRHARAAFKCTEFLLQNRNKSTGNANRERSSTKLRSC